VKVMKKNAVLSEHVEIASKAAAENVFDDVAH